MLHETPVQPLIWTNRTAVLNTSLSIFNQKYFMKNFVDLFRSIDQYWNVNIHIYIYIHENQCCLYQFRVNLMLFCASIKVLVILFSWECVSAEKSSLMLLLMAHKLRKYIIIYNLNFWNSQGRFSSNISVIESSVKIIFLLIFQKECNTDFLSKKTTVPLEHIHYFQKQQFEKHNLKTHRLSLFFFSL